MLMCTSRLTKIGDGNLVALELEIRSGASGEFRGEFVYRDGIGAGSTSLAECTPPKRPEMAVRIKIGSGGPK